MYQLAKILCGAALLCTTASALGVPLSTDPSALAAWRGTQGFTNGVLISTVDYAVFAPGQYGAGDPSGGTQYVYAYQVFDSANSQRDVTNLTVGLQDPTVAHNPAFDLARGVTTPPNPAPNAQVIDAGSSSFISLWSAPTITAGTHGSVVLMTSPNPPQFFSSSVIGFGQQVNGLLPSPSPVPEPASILLAGICGAALLRRRRNQV